MRRAARHVVLALAAAIFVAGCASDGPTPPPPTTSTGVSTPTTTTSVPPSLRPTVAPPVVRTLDLRPYDGRPCDLLTPQQVASVGLPAQPPPRLNTHESCAWPVGPPGKNVYLILAIGLDVLGQAYRESNDRGSDGKGPLTSGLFEPRVVAGQPAVVRASIPGGVACEVIVATGPDQAITLLVGGGDTVDVCAMGVAMADLMVNNLAG